GSYGNGVRTFANSQIINCTFTNNARVGIRISSTDTYVSGNLCVNNRNVGIYATSSNSLFLNNICRNNGTAPSPDFLDTDGTTVVSGNYVIPSDNAFGPIVNVSGVGDISGTTNAKHPFANFEY
ncbi:MAG: right-handed parallel beta-helix repeat-containing protein, partial [Bacteroidota bacterium]